MRNLTKLEVQRFSYPANMNDADYKFVELTMQELGNYEHVCRSGQPAFGKDAIKFLSQSCIGKIHVCLMLDDDKVWRIAEMFILDYSNYPLIPQLKRDVAIDCGLTRYEVELEDILSYFTGMRAEMDDNDMYFESE